MKNDKMAKPMPGKKNNAASTKKAAPKGGASYSETNTPATQKTRARSGDGLANEGTNVSYDEERL